MSSPEPTKLIAHVTNEHFGGYSRNGFDYRLYASTSGCVKCRDLEARLPSRPKQTIVVPGFSEFPFDTTTSHGKAGGWSEKDQLKVLAALHQSASNQLQDAYLAEQIKVECDKRESMQNPKWFRSMINVQATNLFFPVEEARKKITEILTSILSEVAKNFPTKTTPRIQLQALENRRTVRIGVG